MILLIIILFFLLLNYVIIEIKSFLFFDEYKHLSFQNKFEENYLINFN